MRTFEESFEGVSFLGDANIEQLVCREIAMSLEAVYPRQAPAVVMDEFLGQDPLEGVGIVGRNFGLGSREEADVFLPPSRM